MIPGIVTPLGLHDVKNGRHKSAKIDGESSSERRVASLFRFCLRDNRGGPSFLVSARRRLFAHLGIHAHAYAQQRRGGRRRERGEALKTLMTPWCRRDTDETPSHSEVEIIDTLWILECPEAGIFFPREGRNMFVFSAFAVHHTYHLCPRRT